MSDVLPYRPEVTGFAAAPEPARARFYEYRHVISFEETNLVGNVYYASHVRWQGRCREMFLRDRAPEVLRELADGLALATTRVNCEYLTELAPLDEVSIRMFLVGIIQNRISLRFEYWRMGSSGDELVARGEQQVACMRRGSTGLTPAPIPDALRSALEAYR